MAVTTNDCKEFIAKVAPIVQKYAKEYGFKVASPIIAQACLESGYGKTSELAKVYNFFGMKCGSSWNGKAYSMKTDEQKKDGSYEHIIAKFRAYDSLDEGIKGYFEFITGYKRYAKAKEQTTPRAYLQCIKDAGYATSLKYVDNNMNVVNKWNLTMYDDFDATVSAPVLNNNHVALNYKVGSTYQVHATGLRIRTKSAKADVSAVPNGKVLGTVGNGGKVVCRATGAVGNSIWMYIGNDKSDREQWICADNGTKAYVY